MRDYGSERALDLLRDAINIGAHGSMWHHKHMLWAQSRGLQGHKRLNRYESCKDREHYIKLQNYCIDMFGEIIEPGWDYAVSMPADLKDYLENYLDWENSVYASLAAINAQLIDAGFPCEAKLILEGIPGKELKRVRRMLAEYALSGWDMTYILPADAQLHEKMNKIERK